MNLEFSRFLLSDISQSVVQKKLGTAGIGPMEGNVMLCVQQGAYMMRDPSEEWNKRSCGHQ